MEDLSPFIENINRKTRLSPENMERLTTAFQVVKIKKKQLLIQPGFVPKYRIYVLKGAFHSYVIDDKGNEHTIQFAVEDWWLTDYNSYVHQKPATQFVEALENSVILQIDHTQHRRANGLAGGTLGDAVLHLCQMSGERFDRVRT